MSSTNTPAATSLSTAVDPQQYYQYRELNMTAVVGFALGILSLMTFIFTALFFVAVMGVVVSLWALRTIRQRPHELSGQGIARTGLVVSLFSLVGALSIASYVYATEVPDGYQRIDFRILQPDKRHPELPVPPAAIDLSGKKVFVKGYIYPDNRGGQLQKFVLVPDLGTCCFGGQPKLTDMIEVKLQDPNRVGYSMRLQRLGGTLKVDKTLKPISGLQGVYYQLDADYVKM